MCLERRKTVANKHSQQPKNRNSLLAEVSHMTQCPVKLHCQSWNVGQTSHAKKTHPSDPPLIKMSFLEREAFDNDLQEGKCAQQVSIIFGTHLQFKWHCIRGALPYTNLKWKTKWKIYQNSQVFAKKFRIIFFWYLILWKASRIMDTHTTQTHSSWALVIGTILNTCVPAQIPSGSCTNVKEVFIKWDQVCLLSTSFSSLIGATS